MTFKKLDFFLESIRTLKKSGTVTQSSKALCHAMTSHITEDHKVIVEIGAGDGAITTYILDKMAKDAVLYSFEINEAHFRKLQHIQDERLVPIFDSAANIKKHLTDKGHQKADTIISALPFLVMPTEVTLQIISACHKCLLSKSLFVQFHYSKKLKKLYKSTFKHVQTEFVLLNAPPAFVFRCER